MECFSYKIKSGVERLLSIGLVLLISVMSLGAQSRYSALWKEWDKAKANGLPKSGLEQLEKIAHLAKQDKASAEYTQASLLLFSETLGNEPGYAIAKLKGYSEERWLAEADRALLKAFLIYYYASIYEEYSEKQDRQRTEELPIEQIKLWSAAQYLQEISSEWEQFTALSSSLGSLSTLRYPHIFFSGNAANEFKHNLRYAVMDMLILLVDSEWSTLSSISHLVHPEYMSLTYSEIVEGFTPGAVQPQRDDLPKRYLQELLAAETQAPDHISKLVYKRLRYRMLPGEDGVKSLALYDSLIREFEPLIPHSEHLYELYADKADVLRKLNRNQEAVTIAERISREKPRSHAAKRAEEMLCWIRKPLLNLSINEGENDPEAPLKIKLTYREIERVTLKLYHIADPRAVLTKTLQRYSTEEQKRKALLAIATPYQTIEIKPVRNENYEYTDTTFTYAALPLGVYIIEAIPTPIDQRQKEWIQKKDYTLLHVSNVMRLYRKAGSKREALLVDATEGKPLPGASFVQWIKKNGKVHTRIDKSDSNGMVHYTLLAEQWTIQSLAYTDEDTFAPVARQWSSSGSRGSSDDIAATLFTDRALYRPGQKVYFKGMLYHAQEGQKSPIPGEKVSVTAYDQKSGEEHIIGHFETNDYGSFTGCFTLPSESTATTYRLTLSTDTEDYDDVTFRVEEYKRPTFEVKIDTLQQTPYYGQPITLSAKALYYASAPVEEAAVHYRLEASPYRYPYYRYESNENYLIAEGSGTTDSKGVFTLPLTELRLSESDSSRYANTASTPLHDAFISYKLEVSITGKAGETHTASFFFNTGKECVSLASSLLKEQPIEQLLQAWRITTKDYAAKELALSGRYYVVSPSDTTRALLSGTFESGKPLPTAALKTLPAGYYRLYMTTEYKGVKSEAKEDFLLFNLKNAPAVHKEKLFVYPIKKEYSATQPASFLLSSSEKERTIYMYLFTPEQDLRKETIVLHKEQRIIEIPIPKGIDKATVQFFSVSHGRVYTDQEEICRQKQQPTPSLRINRLSKQYKPGEEVTLGISLTDSLGRHYPAELAIWAFDASLEAFEPYRMPSLQSRTPPTPFRGFYSPYLLTGGHMSYYFNCNSPRYDTPWAYDIIFISSPYFITEALGGALYGSRAPVTMRMMNAAPTSYEAKEANAKQALDGAVALDEVVVQATRGNDNSATKHAAPELRSDFAETAFWLPAERLNEKGETTLHFKLPHSLTRYKLALFAFNKELQSYELVEHFTVDKELSLTTNFPRYLREGDKSSMAATLSNKGDTELSGIVYLEQLDAFTDEVLHRSEQAFSLAPASNATYSFDLSYIANRSFVKCRIVADAGTRSDGEERLIPQLAIRKPFIESIPFLLRAGKARTIDLSALFSKGSNEAQQRTLYIDVMGNPLWGALDELPLLLTTNEEDAVSNALSLYTNSVAKSLLRKEPAFKRLLEIRAATGKRPESKLLTDPEKRIADTHQTPFLRDALKEQASLDRLTVLLDSALIQRAEQSALEALLRLRNSDGGFSWMPGMESSSYITQYILYLMAHMEEIDTNSNLQDVVSRAYDFSLSKKREEYDKELRKLQYLSVDEKIDWLYLTALIRPTDLRSGDRMIQAFFKEAKEELPRLRMKSLSHLVVALHKKGDSLTADKAKRRLVEYLHADGERGLMVREGSRYGEWTQIRTQCAAIEALSLYPEEATKIEEMKVWLLNKMRTTRQQDDISTSMVLATLFHNTAPIMTYNGPVSITLSSGKQFTTHVDPTASGVAAPIIKEQITLADKEQAPQSLTALKEEKGIAWGAVVASFTHPAQGIEASSNEALSVSRKLFRHITAENGTKRLEPLDTLHANQLRIGDVITVELIIDAKETLDFVVIRDMRSAALEPGIGVSGYQYNWRSLSFYREIRDSEERFYIERLPKGLHRLSYEAVVDRHGHFFAGVAELQSLYAPDYSAHSAGKAQLVVEK